MIDRFLRTHLRTTALMAVVMLALVGWLDFRVDNIAGVDVSVSLFYTLPILLAALYLPAALAVALALASALVWFLADMPFQALGAQAAVKIWNALMELGFMLGLCLLVLRLRGLHEREFRAARMDGLTGVHNRRAFLEAAGRALEAAARGGGPISLAYIDLDDFKQVNDRHGHAAGDALLQLAAKTLADGVRAADVVARLGGDEFALLMSGADPAQAREACGRIHSQLVARIRARGWEATASVGMVTFLAPPAGTDQMVQAADRLMYEVKRGGKNAVRHEVAGGSA